MFKAVVERTGHQDGALGRGGSLELGDQYRFGVRLAGGITHARYIDATS
jgi:hypothetical protein